MALPRSWQETVSSASGSYASIAIPAIAGITHVVTKVAGTIWSGGSGHAAFGGSVVLQPQGGGGNFAPGSLFIFIPGVTTDEYATGDWDGEFMCLPGQAIVIGFNLARSDVAEMIDVQGYDV